VLRSECKPVNIGLHCLEKVWETHHKDSDSKSHLHAFAWTVSLLTRVRYRRTMPTSTFLQPSALYETARTGCGDGNIFFEHALDTRADIVKKRITRVGFSCSLRVMLIDWLLFQAGGLNLLHPVVNSRFSAQLNLGYAVQLWRP
jgi:hypothetical protein